MLGDDLYISGGGSQGLTLTGSAPASTADFSGLGQNLGLNITSGGRTPSSSSASPGNSFWDRIDSSGTTGTAMGVAGRVMGVAGAFMQGQAEEAQASRNIQALKDELKWNSEVFDTNMTDKMASDKISFFSSGLDYTTGTARDAIANNQEVIAKEKQHMIDQYNREIENQRAKRKASQTSMWFNAAAAIIG